MFPKIHTRIIPVTHQSITGYRHTHTRKETKMNKSTTTITFCLSERNFNYLDGLQNKDLIKDVLNLQYLPKTLSFKRRKYRGDQDGHYYLVKMSLNRADMCAMEATKDHACSKVPQDVYKGTDADKYGYLVSQFIWIYFETLSN